jgi:DNA-binding NtrC family response regulator
MADTLMLTNSRPARFGRPPGGAIELAGSSPAIARAQELARRASAVAGGVILVAERGVDVESVAREVHARGRPAAAPFVAIECEAGDAARLDRVLFGTPAGDVPRDLEQVSPDSGLAAARQGTLFLQDVGELPAAIQARLARVARDGEVRVDGQAVSTDFRIVASASAAIDADVRGQQFRADLYRRLSATRIDLPPLRERQQDLPDIVGRILEETCEAERLSPRTCTQAATALLSAMPWPGNLAELREVLERALAETADEALQIEHLLPALRLDRAATRFVPSGNLRDARLRFERDYIASVLQYHGWRMADAAQTLGIQRPNLYRKARQLGIPLKRLAE